MRIDKTCLRRVTCDREEKTEAVSAKLQDLPDFLMSRNTYVDQMVSMRVLSDLASNECVGLSGSWPLDGCHWKMLAG